MRRLRPLLGTFVAIEAPDGAAIEAAFAAMQRVEALMHPRRPGADVAKINSAPAGVAVPVDPWTGEVLELSLRLARLSGGVFDPCLPEAPGTVFDLDPDRRGFVACRRRVSLDLGGVAKGYAVDRAVDALRAQGCAHGMVNAGGDLRVFGEAATAIWIRAARGYRPLTLRDGACAVSEAVPGQWPAEHRGYYCRSAPVAAPVATAIVVAPTAAVADALTKCVWCCGAAADGWLAQLGARRLSVDVDEGNQSAAIDVAATPQNQRGE